tara:strand:+ start:230 stop:727 length:498 start_codon:yes stop_codon:yes gene_type:complete
MIWNDLATVCFTLLFSVMFENALHKASHYKISGKLHRWHKLHHKDYPVKRLETDVFIDSTGVFNNMFAFWIIVTQGVVFCISSQRVFTIFYIQTTGYSILIEYFHQQFHLKESKWLRYRWFRDLKYNHLIHHIKQETNFGILTRRVDSINKTYVKENKNLKVRRT